MARKVTLTGNRAAENAEQLLVEAAKADRSRFGELYEANFERVYAFVARRVSERAEAQDLTSEVFHQALANLWRFEWRGVPFVAWLYRIAANAINDHFNRKSREAGFMDFDEPEPVSPEETEHRARLFRSVNDLPDDQRRTIIMRFAEQRSIRDIARELGRSEGAIKQLQFRGLQNLRTRHDKRAGERKKHG